MKGGLVALLMLLCGTKAIAQIRVDPTTVNVNSQGASTVFLSYGSIRPDQFSVEALWCADLVSAAPDIGQRCNPATTWGRLPLRNDLTRPSGRGGFTDIMTIPQNVIRRAYQRAEKGSPTSGFYYVRRFSSSTGLPDEYIPIFCRLAGRGSNVPFALTDVKLRFAKERNVLSTPVGEPPPPMYADITYTGTGRLVGRWEIVVPGDELPTPEDLVPEASLPREERSKQRRYTQLSRFNVYMPPVGTYRLEGPEVQKLPTAVEGLYQILLRVEASDDGEGTTDLEAVGAGEGKVTSGGVAGFPLPVLRYYVGSAGSDGAKERAALGLDRPASDELIASGQPVIFGWQTTSDAAFYRLDLTDPQGQPVLSALIETPATKYVSPPLTGEHAATGRLTWKIVALDAAGKEIARSQVGTFRYGIVDKTQAPKPEKNESTAPPPP